MFRARGKGSGFMVITADCSGLEASDDVRLRTDRIESIESIFLPEITARSGDSVGDAGFYRLRRSVESNTML